jgi:hypothetical protein
MKGYPALPTGSKAGARFSPLRRRFGFQSVLLLDYGCLVNFRLLPLALVALLASSLAFSSPVSVKGYYRKDGTYVAPYVRSSPNSTKDDNYSTVGNVNPYTGKEGTKVGDNGATPPGTSSLPSTTPQSTDAPIASTAQAPGKAPALRPGVTASDSDRQTASSLCEQGWKYVMPKPKSPQATWGNHDGRTTWFVGYWTNSTTRATSAKQPVRGADGICAGSGAAVSGAWRRGGSPALPSKVEWLCSLDGGPPAAALGN